MVFNFYGTWRQVTFEKLMMKIYDFFYLAKSFSHPGHIILCKNYREDGRFFTHYYTGQLNDLAK